MEILNYDYIKKHESFPSIEKMDESVRAFLYKHKSELSEGTYNVLKAIWRHSCKFIGVSFAKYDYIADMVNISRRTVIRAVNKLESMGIISRVPTFRASGKRGVNIIVISDYKHASNLDEVNGVRQNVQYQTNMSPQDVTVNEGNLSPLLNRDSLNKDHSVKNKKRYNVSNEQLFVNNVYKQITSEDLPADFTPSIVNKEFIKAASPFFNANKIFELNKRVLIAFRNSKITRPLVDVIHCVIDAFKNTVFMHKKGKIKTFEGYFYKVMEANFVAEKRKESMSYNWLEA